MEFPDELIIVTLITSFVFKYDYNSYK